MARTEKAAFWILVFLLIVGVAAKFYKLEKEVPNLKLSPRAASKESAKPANDDSAGKNGKKDAPALKIVNLNSATAQEIERLPHIGKVTAEKIVAYRSAQGPFKEKTALLRVESISISRYKMIEPYIRME